MTDRDNRTSRFREDDRGVSAIVGVAIMVGLTVALAGLIGVVVFNIGGDVEDSAGATVEFDQSGTDVDVIIDDVDSEVTEITIRGDRSGSDTDPQVGDVISTSGSSGDRIIVVAIAEDGTENRVGQYEVKDL